MSPCSPAPSSFRLRHASAEPFAHPSWQRAEAAAMEALGRGASIALLGRPGTGKTVLLEHVAGRLRQDGVTVAVLRPPVWHTDHPAEVALVDEADSLTASALRELCGRNQVVAMAGLPEFEHVLRTLPRPIEPITLEPLSAENVARFMATRLRRLGRPPTLFTPEAVLSVAAHSDGLMRLVVTLSGSAMFLAEQEGAPQVTARHVEEATALRFDADEPVAAAPPSTAPARPETRQPRSPPPTRRLSPALAGVAAAVLAGIGLWASLQPSGPEPHASRGSGPAEPNSANQAGPPASPAPPKPVETAATVPPMPSQAAPPTPSRPQPDARPPAPLPPADRVVAFRGPVMNVTMRQGGQLTLLVQRQEGSSVTIDFHASSGLIGTGRLTGTMTKDGRINVDGRLMMGRNPFNCVLSAIATGDSLVGEASFTRLGASSSARSTFNLERRS